MGSLPETKLRTLQRLQNRAKMIIKNARHKDGRSGNRLSDENLFRFDRSVMAYKMLTKSALKAYGMNSTYNLSVNFTNKYNETLQISAVPETENGTRE